MSVLVPLDPGVHGHGVAVFAEGVLAWAGYVSGEGGSPHPLLETIQPIIVVADWGEMIDLVIEEPQVYDTPKQKGRQRDIIRLAFVAGAVAGALTALGRVSNLQTVQPAQWKGNLPKSVVMERVIAELAEEEQQVIECPSSGVLHNVYDAIGIGLHELRRIGK